MHVLPWRRGGWSFDGNLDAPTFTPSFRHRGVDGRGQPMTCHYNLIKGMLQFCGDSTHPLKNQVVPLPPLPDWISEDAGTISTGP